MKRTIISLLFFLALGIVALILTLPGALVYFLLLEEIIPESSIAYNIYGIINVFLAIGLTVKFWVTIKGTPDLKGKQHDMKRFQFTLKTSFKNAALWSLFLIAIDITLAFFAWNYLSKNKINSLDIIKSVLFLASLALFVFLSSRIKKPIVPLPFIIISFFIITSLFFLIGPGYRGPLGTPAIAILVGLFFLFSTPLLIAKLTLFQDKLIIDHEGITIMETTAKNYFRSRMWKVPWEKISQISFKEVLSEKMYGTPVVTSSLIVELMLSSIDPNESLNTIKKFNTIKPFNIAQNFNKEAYDPNLPLKGLIFNLQSFVLITDKSAVGAFLEKLKENRHLIPKPIIF